MTNSVLSPVSLGGTARRYEKKSYTKDGIRVTYLTEQRVDRTKRYPVCIIHPVQKWWPSKTANFVFKTKNLGPHYLLQMGADLEWNPSIWLHSKSGRYVLRVPKDRGPQVWKRLYGRGLWYNPATNLWCRRRRRSRKKGYPSFAQSLSTRRKGSKNPPLRIKLRRKG